MPNISQIPLNKVPFLDERTNLVSREWYRFLNNLFTLTGSGSIDASLGDVQVGPEPVYPDDLFSLRQQLSAAEVAPPVTPYGSFARYGDVYDTTTQTAAVINTAYAATLDTTGVSLGVTRGSPTSRIYVDRPGVYNVSVRAQFDKTGGAGGSATLWLRKNGTDVANSGNVVYVTTTNPETGATPPCLIQMAAGQYLEVVWAATDTAIRLKATAAAAPYPATPSVRAVVSLVTG